MKKIIPAVILLFFIAGCGGKNEKKIMIGLVNLVSGDVSIISASGKETPARTGTPVDTGMKVRTKGEKSLCEIFVDENIIKIFGNTEVSIDVLTRDKKTDVEKTSLSMKSGKGFFKIKNKLMKDQEFNVKTQTCIASVRGTEFFVNDTKKSSSVECLDGNVMVKSNSNKDSVEIKANEQAVVAGNSKPVKSNIDDKKIDTLEKDAEIKPVTEENSKAFKGIELGDKSVLAGMRKKLKELKTPKEIKDKDESEEESSGVNLFFFKSK